MSTGEKKPSFFCIGSPVFVMIGVYLLLSLLLYIDFRTYWVRTLIAPAFAVQSLLDLYVVQQTFMISVTDELRSYGTSFGNLLSPFFILFLSLMQISQYLDIAIL